MERERERSADEDRGRERESGREGEWERGTEKNDARMGVKPSAAKDR